MRKSKNRCASFGCLDLVSLCGLRRIVGITEHRAISSKVSADGIGIIGATANCWDWWGTGSGARKAGNCFTKLKIFRNSAVGHVACLFAYPGPRTTPPLTECAAMLQVPYYK